MQHDFYLYGLFPFVVIITAVGIHAVLSKWPRLKKMPWLVLFSFLYFLLSARFFANPIFKGSEGEIEAVQTASVLKQIIPPQARVIVSGRHTPVFLYYLDRAAWNMDLNSIGIPLEPYLKNAKFIKADQEKLRTLEESMADPIKWFQFLQSLGADYYVTSNKRDLEAFPEFLDYLKTHHKLISTTDDDFYCFELLP